MYISYFKLIQLILADWFLVRLEYFNILTMSNEPTWPHREVDSRPQKLPILSYISPNSVHLRIGKDQKAHLENVKVEGVNNIVKIA